MAQIVELTQNHWEDAGALVAQRVRALRLELPCLPLRYEQPDAFLPLIGELAARVPGAAALERGRLAGFLFAMSLPSFKGKRTAFSPEWANAALGEGDGAAIYRLLYAALAPAWLANGCYIHAVRVMANDRAGLEGLYWQGFGLNNVDAVRDLSPLTVNVPGVEIRQATADDIDAITALGEGLQRHLAASPIYLPLVQLDGPDDHLAWLAAPGHLQWLAYHDGEVVAELRVEPTNHTVCAVAADPGTAFITSAYTLPDARSGGLATALLAHALEALRSAGYVRAATDFESANIPGSTFWKRHFQPMGYSVVRYVDERAAYAHNRRQIGDLW